MSEKIIANMELFYWYSGLEYIKAKHENDFRSGLFTLSQFIIGWE